MASDSQVLVLLLSALTGALLREWAVWVVRRLRGHGSEERIERRIDAAAERVIEEVRRERELRAVGRGRGA